MSAVTRREFLRTGAAAAVAGLGLFSGRSGSQTPVGERPHQDDGVEVLHARGRVPLSFIIDVRTGRPLEEISAATMENSYLAATTR